MKQIDEEEAQKQQEMEKQYGKATGSNFGGDKWSFGGNFSFGASDISTFLLLQPMAGYSIKPKTMLGAGATYIYSSVNIRGTKFSNNIYGPILFARQNVLENIFLQTEYQPLNYMHYNDLTNSFSRKWQQVLYVGGGYGSMRGAFIGLFYNVLYRPDNQIYGSPIDFRVGFFF
ncbi:MAG: hypothetical protein ACK4K9_09505 [Bacteroidia bacterium]